MEGERQHRRFEEIPVWKSARILCREIYSITKKKPFCYDSGLKEQIQRASVSILSNIAEGIERGTSEELIYFLFIAKGSAGEVRAQLYVAEDQSYISSENAESLRKITLDISYQLNNWIKSLQRGDAPKGPRYRKVMSEAEKRYEEGKKWLERHVEEIYAKRELERLKREKGELEG